MVLKIEEVKTYKYQNRDMVLRNLKIIDPKSNSIDLLLWDHLPKEIDELVSPINESVTSIKSGPVFS